MRSISTLCFLMAIGAAFAASVPTLTKRSGATILQIKYVAAADGKTFFAEWSPQRTWFQASEYCKLFGMRLASITSQAQLTALRAATSADFSGSYWTAGRDALDTRQFVWDTTGQPLSSETTIYRAEYSAPPQSCVFYHSQSNWWHMGSIPCNQASGAGTLCETY